MAQACGDRVTVHHIPAATAFRGTTTVEKHFEVTPPNGAAQPHPVAYLRGRKLVGDVAAMPAGYTGVVLTIPQDATNAQQAPAGAVADDTAESRAMELPGGVRVWGQFDTMTVWEHDRPAAASQATPATAIARWTEIAELLHGDY